MQISRSALTWISKQEKVSISVNDPGAPPGRRNLMQFLARHAGHLGRMQALVRRARRQQVSSRHRGEPTHWERYSPVERQGPQN